MRYSTTFPAFIKSLITLLFIFFTGILFAQQTAITDYVIFGAHTVEIGGNTNITGGAAGSYHLIKTTGKVDISGNLHSGGKIQLEDHNTVGGIISAANFPSSEGTIFMAGKYGIFKKDINVNGNSYAGYGSKLLGKLTHPEGTTYTGPAPAGGVVTGQPALPGLPQMPAITNFPAAGTECITDSRSIKPGAYDKIALSGNKTLCFSGTGVYIFNSIKNYGATNTFDFDFQNNSTGVIKLYIYGDVDLSKIVVKIKNGGDASRIYAEVHGNGNTCGDNRSAWIMANGPGYADNEFSSWAGTIWAPYGAISLGLGSGNSIVTGALISNTGIYIGCDVTMHFAPFSACNIPDVNAGPDAVLNMLANTILTGSSNTPGVQFSWQGINGGKIISGENTATAEVSSVGTYILTATNGTDCFATDTVIVTGKGRDLIGSELTSLYNSNDTASELSKTIFLIQNDSVYIEVIAIEGQYNQLLTLLQTPDYGMTDLITNGQSKLIITGKFPISNLPKLDLLTDLINFCRPLYPPITNAGVTQSAGDSAMRTNYVRNGFRVQGDSIKVGVLSDSYNTLPGNPAFNDVINGDLPGNGNPLNENPLNVLKDYPYGQRSDEGRAMLQIIHDVAPKAKLSFRTGFISTGDFAQGIRELEADSCHVIVDDITFITEPFFKKGVIDSAITEVSENGVVYITAAGNFGSKSYGGAFNPTDAPTGLIGKAHNFGNGDILQSDSLKGTSLNPGIYTIVLQWEDNIYSLSASGTANDLDIYLADDNGNPIVGYNRNNLGGDPIEVLPFSVTANTVANIMIVNTSLNPTAGLRFKYVVFRGDFKINEYPSESSTIVGHGNSIDAITVGAARYSKTPAFGSDEPILESFSSTGGTILVNGLVSQKPDIIAPDGVNTTVNFSNVDLEGDGLPNFFGTSAAAPHVAGAVALLLQAEKKYYNREISPANVKSTLATTAIDMGTPGFDFNSGYGFIQADEALRSLANPTPQIIRLELIDSSLTPGVQPMEVIIHGNYLSPETKVIFGSDTLPTTIINSTRGTTTLPVFYSNKVITAYTPSKTPSALDGGISNSIAIDGIPKKNITVIANNKTRMYGTVMPGLTTTILVDGDSLHHTTLTVADLGLDEIVYSTPATEASNAGIYYLRPARIFDVNNHLDSLLLEKYNYAFTDGALTITKLPLKITARDTTLVYGQKAGDFKFDYVFDPTATISDAYTLINTISSSHQMQQAEDVIGLVNGQAVTIVNGQAVTIVNGQAVTIVNGQAVTIVNGQAIPIVNGQAISIVNGQAVTIVNNLKEEELDNMSFLATAASLQNSRELHSSTLINGNNIPQTTHVVDITQESILKFNVNSAQTTMLNSVSGVDPKGLVNESSYTNGQAITIVNGQAISIVNGQAITIVNGQAVTIVNGQAVTIVNGQAIPIVNGESKTAVIVDVNDIGNGVSEFKSLNMITGLDAGDQYIIPAAFSNNNFDISYAVGKLTILPVPLSIKAMDTTKVYGAELILDTKRTSITGSFMYGDSIPDVPLKSEGTVAGALPGTYPIIPGPAIAGIGTKLSNYNITYINGALTIGKASILVKANDADKIYGDANPDFTVTYSGLTDGQSGENTGISGSPEFTTSADVRSDVGDYEINVSAGSLSSSLYTFQFESGTLHIHPAPLQVKADDKVIFRYDRLPKFTAKIKTFKVGDHARVQYSLDPSCTGAPGVYSIIPELKHFKNAKNYTITYINGSLYINPRCGDAKDLKPRLRCVEKVSPGKYIAHFYCINENATPVYVPVGWSNFIYSFGRYDASQLPVVFEPGITNFDVPFDGYALLWGLSSYKRCWYKTGLAYASAWSQKCTADEWSKISKNNNTNGFASEKTMSVKPGTLHNNIDKLNSNENVDNRAQGVLRVYPNPVHNRATIYLSNETISEKGASLFDVNGKNYPVKLSRRISDHSFEIDVSDLRKGFYLLKVKTGNGFKSIMIIKG